MLDIDNIDKRILFELDKNSRIPDVQLAKRVGKSKEAVRYRIKKLVSFLNTSINLKRPNNKN